MRSALFVAPFVAVAYGTTSLDYTLVPEISGTVTVTSTFRYSNPATKYLTQTNADGVVTGMPSNTAPTAIVTNQPEVATIPAGLSGTYTLTINETAGLTSFTVVAGSTYTSILGNAQISTVAGSAPLSSGAAPTGGNGHGGSGNGNHNGGAGQQGGSPSSSAAPTTSTGGAMSNAHLASGGLVGLAAFVAALL